MSFFQKTSPLKPSLPWVLLPAPPLALEATGKPEDCLPSTSTVP